MKVKSRNSARRRSFVNANLPIPDLTNDVRSFIQNLGDSPREVYLKDQAWSKFVSSETDAPSLRKQRAIDKWLAQEEINAETNVRLAFTPEDFHILPRVSYSEFMAFLTSLVETTIGAVPTFPDNGGFSGGASTSRKRTESAPALKFTGQAHITARASGLIESTTETISPVWADLVNPDEYLVPHESNTLFTVPKNTTIDRCACKEPDINMFLQKGLGNQIRRALRRVGVNLNDQSVNQRLARKGSADGSLATLDLSSASDSVTWEFVFQVMPLAWFTLLDSTRSEITMIGDEEHVNEMFSSMGNGFTFELESLLFWGVARTVAYFRGIKGIVSVYGDDIIIPVDLYDDLVWVLSYFGFKVNPEKSFATGTFRESCGGHYDAGIDITPFYIRRPIDSVTEAIVLANNIRKFAGLDGLGVLDPTMLPLWEYVVHHIPECLRGGRDLGSNLQVVCVREPHLKLQPITRKRDTSLGGYLHWLSASCDRRGINPPSVLKTVMIGRDLSAFDLRYSRELGSALITNERSESEEVFRLRRARKRWCEAPPTPFWGPGDSIL